MVNVTYDNCESPAVPTRCMRSLCSLRPVLLDDSGLPSMGGPYRHKLGLQPR